MRYEYICCIYEYILPISLCLSACNNSPPLLPANRQYWTDDSWDFGMQYLRPEWNETRELSQMPSGDTLLYLAPYTLGPEEVAYSTKRKKINVF